MPITSRVADVDVEELYDAEAVPLPAAYSVTVTVQAGEAIRRRAEWKAVPVRRITFVPEDSHPLGIKTRARELAQFGGCCT